MRCWRKRDREKLKLKLLEVAAGGTRASWRRRHNESSGKPATNMFHKRRSSPKAGQARTRNEFWKCRRPRRALAPIRSSPATTDRNLETKEPAALLTMKLKRPESAKARLRE